MSLTRKALQGRMREWVVMSLAAGKPVGPATACAECGRRLADAASIAQWRRARMLGKNRRRF